MDPEHQQRAEIRKVLDDDSKKKSVLRHKPPTDGSKPKRGALKKPSPSTNTNSSQM